MLLSDEEIKDLVDRDYPMVSNGRWVAKAQLKKVIEDWKKKGSGYHKLDGQYQTFGIPMDCWQALLNEVKDATE